MQDRRNPDHSRFDVAGCGRRYLDRAHEAPDAGTPGALPVAIELQA